MTNHIKYGTYRYGDHNTYYYADGTDTIATYSYTKDIQSGSNNKNWLSLVAARKDAGNSYSRELIELQYPFYEIKTADTRHPDEWGIFRKYLTVPSYVPATDLALRDQALGRLKRKLGNDTKQFNALVPLAQIGELRGLVSSVATSALSLTKALVDVKRGRLRDASKVASDLWLTFGFGVAPTLADIKSVTESINAFFNEQHIIRHVGFAEKEWTEDQSHGAAVWGNYVHSDWRIKHKLGYKFGGCFTPTITSANNYDVADQLGFNFQSLPSVGWELIPYSWVVDYFTTAGAYFDDAFSAPSTSTVYAYENYRYQVGMESKFSIENQNPYYPIIYSILTPGFHNRIKFTRTMLSDLPTRSLRLKTVDEIGIRSINKLLNLSAILAK